MKDLTIMKYLRMSIVGLFATITFICVVGEPSEEDAWFEMFFFSKLVALVTGYITYVLVKRWDAKGLLPDMMDEDDEEWK